MQAYAEGSDVDFTWTVDSRKIIKTEEQWRQDLDPAAYEAIRLGIGAVVLEKSGDVGGLARTAVYKGFHFDMGGHRFFTKSAPVEKMWRDVLGGDLLRRPRLSRIYYRGRFFQYPLKAWNALAGLGIWQSIAPPLPDGGSSWDAPLLSNARSTTLCASRNPGH